MGAPRNVLDLGANIGLTAVHYAHLWPDAKVVAVEMNEESANLAERNAPGVKILHEAVSDKAGAAFYDPAVLAEAMRITDKGSRRVPCRTLARIITRSFGGPVDFLKVDVEGMEARLFKAAEDWAPLVRHLVVEVHEQYGYAVADALRDLAKAGFHAERHPPHPCAIYAWRS